MKFRWPAIHVQSTAIGNVAGGDRVELLVANLLTVGAPREESQTTDRMKDLQSNLA
jgi:hypothetical protein